MRTVKKYRKPGVYEVVVPFDQEGVDKEWVGILRAESKGEYELRVVAEHTVEKTRGRVVVRGVASNGAEIKLSGMIKIHKEAQGTDSFLELRVLLLDDLSRATALPQLEIEANEVKAGHAASVSKVDAEQVLYLMSRGLSQTAAEREIIEGWLVDERVK